MPAKLRTRLRQKRALLRRSREGLAPYLEISQIRERLDTIENRLELLEDDLELIEDNLDINSSMADNKIVTAEGTVGVGSTAPVGVGSTAPVGVGSSNDADAGRERWVKDVTDYEHKQFVEIHEKYQKLREELEEKFKAEIEKAKAVAAAELAPAPDGQLGYHVGVGTSDTSEADDAFAVGVGSSAPPGTTHTDPDTSADGAQSTPDPDFS